MAVLRERQPPEDDRFQHSLDRAASRTVDDVATLLERNQTDPEWVAFYSGSLAEALRVDHPAREFFTFRYRLFRASLAQSLRNAAEDGTIRADVPAPELAALIIAVLDGLQQQWLYDADLDMVALYRTFRRLLDAPGRPAADEPRR